MVSPELILMSIWLWGLKEQQNIRQERQMQPLFMGLTLVDLDRRTKTSSKMKMPPFIEELRHPSTSCIELESLKKVSN
jgi:hypothetical protein